MIKRITSLINNKLLLPPQSYRFTAGKQQEYAQQQIQLADGEQLNEKVQAALQTGGQLPEQVQQALQGQEVAAQQVKKAYEEEDDWQKIQKIDSNWKQMASYIHTNYYVSKNNPFLMNEVGQKLKQIQMLYGFDLMNLDRVKIYDRKQYDLKKLAIASSSQHHRYNQISVDPDTRIGYGLLHHRKFKELIQNKQLRALRYMYRNGEFNSTNLTNDMITYIIQQVVQSQFQNQFLLNLTTLNKTFNNQEGLLKSTKNLERVLQNIHNLNEVDKLKFFWSVSQKFQNSQELINYNVINHELAKVYFEGFDQKVSQKALRYLYSSTLGRQPINKLISYSLSKYTKNFQQFMLFWGLINILLIRLSSSYNQIAVSPQQGNLNIIFQLIQFNLNQPKQIIVQLIPQILHQTKNKNLFQVYRVQAKQWLEKKKVNTANRYQSGALDQFINTKIQFQDPIKICYQPFDTKQKTFQNWYPVTCYLKTSNKPIPRQEDLINQTKMIQNLLKGNYNFVLNYFLLIYHSTVDKRTYNQIRAILHQAQNYIFQDNNAKALYILKQINQKCIQLGQPVSFTPKFLQTFKTVKSFEREKQRRLQRSKQRRIFDEQFQQRGKFSRKKDQSRDPIEPYSDDNRQRIRNKPKKYPEHEHKSMGGALFKKSKHSFSTQQKPDSYTQYRQVVKDLTQNVPQQFKLSFDSKIKPEQFQIQIQKKAKQLNQRNHRSLFNQSQIPIVGSGANLIKYLFLQKPTEVTNKIDERIRKRLQVSLISQIGALQKDFSTYIQNTRFNFALAPQVYVSLLQQQKVNYLRKSYKTIVSHMIAYRNELTHPQIQLICQIAQRNRIGITLIEIYSLLIDNKIKIPTQSIYTFCATLQKFKKINADIFLMTKKYCQNIGIDFQMRMLSAYARSLMLEQQNQKLAQLCEILKAELKPEPYKVKPNLSTEQNIKLEKQYKQYVRKEYNKVLLDIVDLIVHNVSNKLPPFISEYFDQYEKTKTKLNPRQIAISLIVYCNNVQKFLSIIRALRQSPQQITTQTYQCSIKAISLNVRQIQSHSEQIFNVTLFKHNFILNEDQVTQTIQLFKQFHTPTVFIKFLEYVLRYNIPMNYEIKNHMYLAMNNINDDFSKNTISALLDFIFNVNRQKERETYRKEQIAEEQKARLLAELEKKQDTTNVKKVENVQTVVATKLQTPNQKPVKNKPIKQKIQQQLAQDVIIDTSNSAEAAKMAMQDLAKTKVEKPGSAKSQKRNIKLKPDDATLSFQQSDGFLKKSNLKKKLRNKAFNDFEQMFTQKQQAPEDLDLKAAKAKGLKQPNKKEGKKPGNKKGGK